MEYVLETKDLTKQYSKCSAIENMNMSVRFGSIYGLVGRNGAGKTTLLKIIGGLARPTGGEIRLSGKTMQHGMEKALRIGVLLEQPGIYPNMSARQNLKLKCLAMGIKEKDHIDELLNIVGLANEKKNVKKYSVGMRQRLGIALALVGYPELVILDEPINGLDPQGIAEFRNMIAWLNRERSISFIISSHILAELTKIVTDYGIIHNGVLIEQISAAQLLDKFGDSETNVQASFETYYFNLTGGCENA